MVNVIYGRSSCNPCIYVIPAKGLCHSCFGAESRKIDREGLLDFFRPRTEAGVTLWWIGVNIVGRVDIYDKTMSFLRKQESKEIDRKGALDILDPAPKQG